VLCRHITRLRLRVIRGIAILALLAVVVSALVTSTPLSAQAGNAQQGQGPKQQQDNGKARKVKPAAPDKNKPKQALPSLDELRAHRDNHVEMKPAEPSVIRSKRKPLQKWDGRKFGDPGTTGQRSAIRGQKSANDARGFHHANATSKSRLAGAPLPPTPDDTFVVSFVGNALGRSINGTEQAYWDDILRSAYYQGPDALFTAGREMGRTLFQSQEYYNRGRSNHEYVYDLYMTYLMRDPGNPDDGGWGFWTGVCDSYGREAVRAAFDACGDFYNLITSITPNGGISGSVGSISSARVDPFNQSGNQIQARDAEWSLPLISLPGRAGLDLGLGLSYSSMVWTKSGPYLYFDEDISQISPGFHLGFASIQGPYFDPATHQKVYMLVSSAGRRVELRQVGDGAYEAADSSHLMLVEGGHVAAQEVQWTNVSGVSVNGATLAATYGYWGAGASSTQMISSGDGYVEATIAETNTYRMIGLGNTDSNQSYTDIDFAWYPIADGTLQIYESGGYVGSFGPYAIGDRLRVAVEGGVVRYRKNGQLLYTSTHSPTYPLAVDTSFYHPGSTFNNVVMSNGSLSAPSGALLLCGNDGTQMLYSQYASDWQATQVKDRNGNYLTIDNDWRGDIHTITDTLGRVLYFNNDGNGNLSSITQYTGSGWQTWASFGWGSPNTMSVSSMSGVVGTYHGEAVPVLRSVNLMDGSYHTFDYTGAGQVYVIRRYAYDNSQQSYVAYDYDGATADCPRINQTRVWAAAWNGSPGVPGEVATQFDVVSSNGHRMIKPDGTSYIEYYGSGWQNGLVTDARVYVGGGLQRQSTTAYTQDNTGVHYQINPRVAETNVYDAVGNRRRTTVDYTGSFGLPSQVTEYDANASSVLRYTRFEYVDDSYYTSRRIISLPSRETLYNGGGGVEARTSYGYDAGSINAQAQYAVQHDYSYDTNYYARGNATEVFRWDASDPDNQSKRLTSEMTYDAAGNLLSAADPANHTTTLNYGDSFSDSTFHNAYAYPGIMTDADSYSSYVQYNYDFGAKTRTEGPPPAGQSVGAIQYFYYDGARRLYEIYDGNTGGATYFGYGPNYSQTWASVNSLYDNYSLRYFDGFGRETVSLSYHPSTGTYGTQLTYYDVMGRVSQQSNPTEMYGNWSPSADEAGGWIYSYQTYDWKGRPLVTTNQDGTQKYASYNSCGCAGSEVVTLTDERGKQQRVYSDVLGRQYKAEVLNWNSTVYSTTESFLNVRDQAYLVRRTDNATGGYQDANLSYDGYGRLQSKHDPQQNSGTNTTFVYNNDDTVYSVTDARGASATYGYNNRHRVTSTSYSAPAGISIPSAASFGYDAAGNRTSMNDGSGTMSYGYDSLSRMTSETKTFNGLGGSFTISYGYNLASEVTSVTDQHSGTSFSNAYDGNGRVNSVSGSGYGGAFTQFASQIAYRAFGAPKLFAYGNNTSISIGYDSRGSATSFTANFSGYYYGSTYQYYSDGTLKFAQDQSTYPTPTKDRAYNYDHAGRMTEAYSGAQARDFINSTNSGVVDGPYRQSYAFDVWDNVTNDNWRFWSRSGGTAASFNSSNRNTAWSYDSNGNLLSRSDGAQYSYDAAGRRVNESQTNLFYDYQDGGWVNNVINNASGYDEDGQLVHYVKSLNQTFNGNPTGSYSNDVYSLHSTVLGGRVISEYDGQGAWTRSYVYAGGERIGEQTRFGGSAVSYWRYKDPVVGDEGGTVLDPQGVDVGLSDPFPPNGGGDPDGLVNGGDPVKGGSVSPIAMEGGGAQCVLDGITVDCSFVRGWISKQCPDNDCNQRHVNISITDTDGNTTHQSGWVDPFLLPAGFTHTWTGQAAQKIADELRDNKSSPFQKALVAALKAAASVENEEFGNAVRHHHVSYFADPQKGPCEQMARNAQDEADRAILNARGDYHQALTEFDKTFAAIYLGRTSDAGEGRPMRTFADVIHYARGGETRHRLASGNMLGQSDFAKDFYENSPRGDAEDQTHHFAAYFSLGINNRPISEYSAEMLDRTGGRADNLLGAHSYVIGDRLRKDPYGLNNIGAQIRGEICR
jgi:YD repeat-containing protein